MMNLLPQKIQLNRMEELINMIAKMILIRMHLKVNTDVNIFKSNYRRKYI